jgi:SAM-dependent methyltransferase
MPRIETTPDRSVLTFDKFADEYDQKYQGYQPYIRTYEKLGRFLPRGQRRSVLDIACGPAHALRYLISEGFELDVFGFDLSQNMLRVARTNVPNGKFEQLDCRNLDRLKGVYDIVICGFCVPYLEPFERSKLVKDIACSLNPGGIAYISSIEGENYYVEENISPSGDCVRIHHHPSAALLHEFSQFGLHVIEVERKVIVTSAGSENVEVFFYVRSGS